MRGAEDFFREMNESLASALPELRTGRDVLLRGFDHGPDVGPATGAAKAFFYQRADDRVFARTVEEAEAMAALWRERRESVLKHPGPVPREIPSAFRELRRGELSRCWSRAWAPALARYLPYLLELASAAVSELAQERFGTPLGALCDKLAINGDLLREAGVSTLGGLGSPFTHMRLNDYWLPESAQHNHRDTRNNEVGAAVVVLHSLAAESAGGCCEGAVLHLHEAPRDEDPRRHTCRRGCVALPAPAGAFQIVVADLEETVHSSGLRTGSATSAAFAPRASVVFYQHARMVRYAEGLKRGAFSISSKMNSTLL